jgi:hypothetical protein
MAKLANRFEVANPFHIYTAIHKGQYDQLVELSVTARGDKS